MSTFAQSFENLPIIGILRGITAEHVVPVIDAAAEGGLTCVEITLNTTGALDLIALAAKRLGSRICLGAGTVLTAQDAEKAIDAGAQFIVAPNTNAAVMAACKKRSVPVIPGALTPTEIQAAWEAGAAVVKVFPVSAMGGPAYIRDLRGPFDSIRLLACGGVTHKNLGDYIKAGANGIAFGASVFSPDAISQRDYVIIREKTAFLVKALAK